MACGAAWAQAAADREDRVTIELKDVDVRSAIEALFKGKDRNYVIDADAKGTVPAASFTDVPFLTALKQLTRSAGLVFRVGDNNVYVITKRAETTPSRKLAPSPIPDDYLGSTTESEFRIDKVMLSHTSGTELLAMLNQPGGNRTSAQSKPNGGGVNPYSGSPVSGRYDTGRSVPYGGHPNYSLGVGIGTVYSR